MVTRLQSAKGSFVQSPKGAFDGEADEYDCVVAEFIVNEQLGSNPIGLDTSVGTVLDVDSTRPAGQPLDYLGFRFSTTNQQPLGQLLPPFSVLQNWYFTGQTSSAVWRPIDWGPFAFTYWEWNSFSVPPARTTGQIFTATGPQTVVGDIEYYNEWYSQSSLSSSNFDVQTNPGYGISRDLRDLGFIDGELVDVCDTPPFVRSGQISLIVERPGGIAVVGAAPNCTITQDISTSPAGYNQYVVAWDDPRPVYTDLLTHKWVGMTSGAVLDPTAVGLVCNVGIFGDTSKVTDAGGLAYLNTVGPGLVNDPTTGAQSSYLYNYGFFNLPDPGFQANEPIALVPP